MRKAEVIDQSVLVRSEFNIDIPKSSKKSKVLSTLNELIRFPSGLLHFHKLTLLSKRQNFMFF